MSDTPKQNANFGLPETPEQTIARLTAALADANQKLLAKGDDGSDPDEGTGPVDSQGFPKKYVRVEVFQGREKHDLSYVPLGIGGYALRVTRGVEVIIPEVFEQVLAHAVEEITVQSEGGLITRPALRFPYAVRGTATEEEFLAFRAANSSLGAKAALRT